MAARGWCFTVNNYTVEELLAILKIECEYLVVGDEVGEEGTPHLQGYVYFAKRGRRFNGVKSLDGLARAHIEPAKGTAEQNRTYCTKSGEYMETGVMPHAGKRTDINGVREAVMCGATMNEIIQIAPSYQTMRMAELMMKYVDAPIRDGVKVKWFWGATGTGKTHTAMAEAAEDFWVSSGSMAYWNGYYGQSRVIFDDFRAGKIEFIELLKILSQVPYHVNVKGTSVPLRAMEFWITAPVSPQIMFDGMVGEDPNQLFRRIHEIREFQGVPGGVPEVGGNTKDPDLDEEKKE